MVDKKTGGTKSVTLGDVKAADKATGVKPPRGDSALAADKKKKVKMKSGKRTDDQA